MSLTSTENNQKTRGVMLRDVRANKKVRAYIEKANEQMKAIGYTEHGVRHVSLVAAIARNVLQELGAEPRLSELASIAGYLHDIGNVVSRHGHPQIGATMAFTLLNEMGMEAEEIALIVGAIGNHEEGEGVAINAVTAAVILADKSDVHFTRVQNVEPGTFDIHDRVNYAVQKSHLTVNAEARTITLELDIDTSVATIMEYFEIFVGRMVLCRQAAAQLSCRFQLSVNGVLLG